MIFPQLEKMVDLFLERGFTYFDTAYMYHDFQSEIALRKALVERYPRDSFTVADKMPTMMLKEKEDIPRIFSEQLEKTAAGYFDYYLMHNINANTYPAAQRLDGFSFLQQKKQEGLIKVIGFSFHDKVELLEQVLSDHPEVDFVQLQINYLDWKSPAIQSQKCYDMVRSAGKKIMVMEPVKGGTLAKDQLPQEVVELFREEHPDWSAPGWAIRFAADLEGVQTVLSGMSNMEQLEDNTSYMQNFTGLSGQEHRVIENAAGQIQSSVAIACTACQYCVEGCPVKIDIPGFFSLYNSEKRAASRGFSINRAYYANTIRDHAKASDCIKCGKCETACPQHLKIRNNLEMVADTYETAVS